MKTSFHFPRIIAAAFASALFPAVASAAITWDPASSSHTGTDGGFIASQFVTGGGTTNNISGNSAAAAGTNLSGIYTIGFQQQFNPTPTMVQTDLSGTPLVVGTTVTLFFDKAAGDNINFVIVSGDPTAAVEYEVISETRFRVTAKVVNPVATHGGDIAATFGVVINYQATPVFDFHETIFVSDMHFFDLITVMDTINSGVMTFRLRGANGTNGTIKAYIPNSLLPRLNAANANAVEGYVNRVRVPEVDFLYLGPGSFDFSPTGTTASEVQIFSLRNSAWSVTGDGKDLQIGKILTPAPRVNPNAALKAQLIAKIAKLKKQIRKVPKSKSKLKAKLRKKLKRLTVRLRAL